MISISTILLEDIEKAFAPVLPKQCVRMLMLMAEQNVQLEKTLNEQHRLMMKMAKYIMLTHKSDEMIKQMEAFEHNSNKNNQLAVQDILEDGED